MTFFLEVETFVFFGSLNETSFIRAKESKKFVSLICDSLLLMKFTYTAFPNFFRPTDIFYMIYCSHRNSRDIM